MDIALVKQVAMPAIALAVGGALLCVHRCEVMGRLFCFFGSQTGMTLYMKHVLSDAVIEEGKKGFPAAFVVTALQQLTGFILMVACIGLSSFTSFRYSPRQLTSGKEWLAVCLFSLAFTLNVALNNWSVALLPIPVNLIIRSCFPLPTFLAQQLVATCTNEDSSKDTRPLELSLMLLGCIFAAVAVEAKTRSIGMDVHDTQNLILGVFICVLSCFAGSMNLVLASLLGTSVKLNEFDTVLYTAIPAVALLVLPVIFFPHTTNWVEGVGDDKEHMFLTDYHILRTVLAAKPGVFGLAILSGVFALGLNLVKYGIVQRLSATHTAFAGNFNKAATITLAMAFGLEQVPNELWGYVMVLACLGNIAAFTGYNIAKLNRPEVSRDDVMEDVEKTRLNSAESTEDLELNLSRTRDTDHGWEDGTQDSSATGDTPERRRTPLGQHPL